MVQLHFNIIFNYAFLPLKSQKLFPLYNNYVLTNTPADYHKYILITHLPEKIETYKLMYDNK